MFATGIDPFTGKSVYVARDGREKRLQRALLQFNRPENAPIVREALVAAHREDLIGNGKDCLVRAGKLPSGEFVGGEPTDKGRKDQKRGAPTSKNGKSGKKNSLSKHLASQKKRKKTKDK
jgi:hypothetical protein